MSVGEKLPSADMIEARRCWVLDEGLVHSRSWTPEAVGSYETAASFPSRSCNPRISKRTNKWVNLAFWQNFWETSVFKSHTETGVKLKAAFTLFCLSLFMTSVRAGYPPRYLHRWTETEEDKMLNVKMQIPDWRMIQFGILYSYLVQTKLASELSL